MIKIFEKSFQGNLAHFNGCLISGYIMLHFISLPVHIYLTGTLVATVSEALLIGIDDNFSVAILSAASMSGFYFF